MQLALIVQVLKAPQQFAADDGDVVLFDDARLELRLESSATDKTAGEVTHKVRTASAGAVLHDDPEHLSTDEGSKVPRSVRRV